MSDFAPQIASPPLFSAIHGGVPWVNVAESQNNEIEGLRRRGWNATLNKDSKVVPFFPASRRVS